MYYYNKSIIFEFEFIKKSQYNKIIIENNKIKECENKIIKIDIEKKIKKMNKTIEYIEFYTSLYDYEIIEKDEYWETIKNLDIKNLPIYLKKNDIEEYIKWLKNNFNNNKTVIYETSKFTKREHKFEPEEKEKCLKSIKWEQTNKRFQNFEQIFYHAGDNEDIERYGYLYLRTIYSKIKKIKIESNIYESSNKELKLWDKFETDFESIQNTMYYMFNKMKKGILVSIKNNKLAVYLPFSNAKYKNDFYTELYFDEKDKKNLEEYKKNPSNELKKKLENTLKYYLSKYKLNTKNILWDRTKWVANDCFFRYENYEGDKSEAAYEDFLKNLCENRKISDCTFFLNLRDHPMLNKNLKDSYTNLVDKKLDSKYIYDKYAPILSPGGSTETADICICTPDDWLRVGKKIYPDDCLNGYINNFENVKWEDKINKAVFRGSATGCELDEENIRIKASMISKKNPEYLDAGITSLNRKLKKKINSHLNIIDNKINKSDFMTLQEKATYKYILNLDGHVSAFRLGHEFSLGSVILLPKSKYYLWFSYLLIPYEHYVPIDEKLENLIEQIKWCNNNDEKCKIIANNGINFYKKYLEKNGLYDYMQYVLNKISLKTLNLKKIKNIKKIAIITIYRNIKDNQRLEQKRLFTYWMNKLLSQICNYDIIIVEQSEKYPFNIGKLKNIGYDYLKKNSSEKYHNYIFADIDTLPDSKLIDYFFKQTDSLNSLALYGTRYENLDLKSSRPFVGALISSSSEIFEKLNGYPNNFYGWEGEDTNLLLRLSGINKPLYTNLQGRIIDIEETKGHKKNISEKINELNQGKERENLVYEKNINWENFKSNGLSNLNYKILHETKESYLNSNNYHIIVDLDLENDKIKYPNDYIFDKNYDKNFYKNYINEKIYSIKQIKF